MDYLVEGACIPRMVWYRWLREALGLNDCAVGRVAGDAYTKYEHMDLERSTRQQVTGCAVSTAGRTGEQ